MVVRSKKLKRAVKKLFQTCAGAGPCSFYPSTSPPHVHPLALTTGIKNSEAISDEMPNCNTSAPPKNYDRQLWKLGTLPPGLITFWKRTYALDRSWHVLGLGYNPNVSQKDIERAAVVHYNGNLKPWLEIGIPKFKNYWTKYIDYDQQYLRECNLSP